MKGFNEYKAMFLRGELIAGQVISVHEKHGSEPVKLKYTVIDTLNLNPLHILGNSKARKTLQGREWDIVKKPTDSE